MPGVSFIVPLNPVPASRPRVARNGWTYYEKKYKTFKAAIGGFFTENHTDSPIEDEVVVEIYCHAESPKSSVLPSPLPDVDNYAKAVMDGMNGIVLKDDRLVKRLVVEKHWLPYGVPGYIEVVLVRYTLWAKVADKARAVYASLFK